MSFRDTGGGRLDITVGPKQTMGKTVNNFSASVELLHVNSYYSVLFISSWVYFRLKVSPLRYQWQSAF